MSTPTRIDTRTNLNGNEIVQVDIVKRKAPNPPTTNQPAMKRKTPDEPAAKPQTPNLLTPNQPTPNQQAANRQRDQNLHAAHTKQYEDLRNNNA